MERRKFLLGMGAVAAGGAAALGTGAFEGAYISAERTMAVNVVGDRAAYLRLVDVSPYASYESSGEGSGKLRVNLGRLNPDADTRLDDVFQVQNTSGRDVRLEILDGADSAKSVSDYNESSKEEDALQIFADTDGGGGLGQRLDTGSDIPLGPGDKVSINLVAFLRKNDPSSLPEQMLVIADGTS
jgi:hypothetical protein